MKRLLPVLLLLFCSPALAALSAVTGHSVSGNPPGTCSISASVGIGQAIVVVEQGTIPSNLTIADNVNSGNYSLISTAFTNMGIFWKKTTASGTPGITVSGTTGSTTVWCFAITGFFGTPTVDTAIENTATGASTTPTIGATSNFNNEVMLVHAGKTYTLNITVSGWSTGTSSQTSGFYAIEATSGTANSFNGSIGSSQTWDLMLAGIYDSVGAAGPPKSQFFFGG